MYMHIYIYIYIHVYTNTYLLGCIILYGILYIHIHNVVLYYVLIYY